MAQFLVIMDKDKLDMDLLRTADDSLPRLVRYMNTCMPFVGLLDGRPIASCLVDQKEAVYDIVNLAVTSAEQGKGYGKELLLYVLDYIKSQGGRYVETGCGNASIRLHIMFQRAGFRYIGVWPDYYLGDSKTAVVENSIVNRDMVRFRADLNEKRLATIGYDASGRT